MVGDRMRKLAVGILFLLGAVQLHAKEHDWTLYPPRIPEPKIVEIPEPDPQQAQRNASFDKLNVRSTATFTGAVTIGAVTFPAGTANYPTVQSAITAACAATPIGIVV